jgi:hydroxyacylglutathione hydrolase
MQIRALPLLEDNYAWLIFDERRGEALVVDPGAALAVLEWVRGLEVALRAILVTHHHPDHVGGVAALLRALPDLLVVGSAVDRVRLPWISRAVSDGERLELLGEEVQCLAVPGHTQGSTAYFFPHLAAVFSGDTLLLGGCGRLLEGSDAQMQDSLRRFASLPPHTQVYCGHERTERNLRFAAALEPGNLAVQQRLMRAQQARAAGLPTVPAAMAEELATNPFLRTGELGMRSLLGVDSPAACFVELDRRRERF